MGLATKVILEEPPPSARLTPEEAMRLNVRTLFNYYGLEPTKRQTETILGFLGKRKLGKPRGRRSPNFRARDGIQVSKTYERLELFAAVEICLKLGLKRGMKSVPEVCKYLSSRKPFNSAKNAEALTSEYHRARRVYDKQGYSPNMRAFVVETDVDLAVAHFPSLRTIYHAL